MANKRSAASSRGRDLFRTEVSSLLADLSELAGEQVAHPVPAETPPVAAEPAVEALGPVAPGTGADREAAPRPGAGRPPGRGSQLPLAELPPPAPPGPLATDRGPGAGGTVRARILCRRAGSAARGLGGRTGAGGTSRAVAGGG